MKRLRRRRRFAAELLEQRRLLAGDFCDPTTLMLQSLATPGSDAAEEIATSLGSDELGSDELGSDEPAGSTNLLVQEAPRDLQWIRDWIGDASVTYVAGLESIELAPRTDLIAVEGDNSFFDPGHAGIRPIQNFGTSVSVFRLPNEVLVGPSFVPVFNAALSDVQSNQSNLLPVFASPKTESMAVATDQLIVKVDSVELGRVNKSLQTSTTALEYVQQLPGVTDVDRLTGTQDQFVLTVDVQPGHQTFHQAERLDKDPVLEWATPNLYQNWQRFAIPNDPRFGNQWHLDNTGQEGGLIDHDANLTGAWDVNPGGSPNIIVGVVDDGVAIDHEDLTVWVNPGEIADNGVDDDGNGWVDDVHGWNFVSNNNNSSYTSTTDAHGTAVAGVATADGDNGTGVVGAAYQSSAISARIFEGSSVASDANIAGAVYYMAGRTANGTGTWDSAHIANHSWGGGLTSVAISDAFAYATSSGGPDEGGINNFVATGNGAGPVSFPANLSPGNVGVVAVGGTGNTGLVADYSSFGPQVDIVAPTVQSFFGALAIDTTDLVGNLGYDPSNYTGTGANGFGGTSSATPLATGIGALALAELELQNIDLTPEEFKNLIRNNTRFIADLEHDLDGHNVFSGFGMIDAQSLLESIGKPEISVTSSTMDLIDNVTAIEFPFADLGTSSSVYVRVRNQGTEDLDLSAITIATGPFTIDSGGSPAVLGVGDAVTVSMTFTPTELGVNSGLLEIASNDSDEPLFKVPLEGLGTFVAIDGTVFEDREGDGVLDGPNQPVSGELVYLDENANGELDLGTTFTNTTDFAITDGQTSTSPITVSGVTDFNRIEVAIDISHTYTSDLTIDLVGPDGTTIALANNVGGSGDDFAGTLFDDSAVTSINEGSAPFTGRFRPAQPLSTFDGIDANGQWTLDVFDGFFGDTGSINEWSITIGQAEPTAITDAQGVYRFRNLADATYQVGFASDRYTAVAPAGHVAVTLSQSVPYQGVDFGIAKNDVAYLYAFNDVDGDGVVDQTDGLLPDPLIYLDGNSNGVFDPPQLNIFLDDDNVAITDNTTVNSTQTVGGLLGGIADVDVLINATHTWVSDVSFALESPDGTVVDLVTRRGDSGNDFVDLRLDDESNLAISEGSAPFTGSFRPESPLSAFDGLDPNGTWTLSVTDSAGGDIGTLDNWSLILSIGDTSTPVDADGWLEFPLPPGDTTLGLVPDPFYQYTVPANGQITLTADGTPQLGILFGAQEKTASISGTVFHDFDGAGEQNAGEDGLPEWTVFIDEDDDGTLDTLSEFKNTTSQEISFFRSTESEILVSGAAVLGGDLVVGVEIDYPDTSSLLVQLTGPDGTQIILADSQGDGSANFTGTVFDDDAAVSVVDGSPPFTGSFRPEQPLSTFDGVDPNGTWTLEISTGDFENSGALNSWSLQMGAEESSVLTNELGYYAFFDLADGDYDVNVQPPAGWEPTADGSQLVSLSPSAPSQDDVDFGFAQTDHAYLFAFDDADGDGIYDSDEAGFDGALMYVDEDGNSMFEGSDEVFIADAPFDIVDLTTVTDTLEVTGLSGPVNDIDFYFDAAHTWNSDVQVRLISPTGTNSLLIDRVGGFSQNFSGTVLDDEADVDLAAGSGPFTGTFRPSNPLSTFDGVDPIGTWTLEVIDNAGGDVGTVLQWGMRIRSGEQSFAVDQNGWSIQPIASGQTVSFGLVAIDGFQYTVPSDGTRDVTGDGTALTGLMFGATTGAASEIAGHHLFYHNTTGSQISSDGNAQAAIDPSKEALLPGQSSSFANYSNYMLGLNGLAVDFSALPAETTDQTVAGGFLFETWNGIASEGWQPLDASVAAEFTIHRGQGNEGTDRVKIAFPDNAIENTWLRTTVLAGAETGIISDSPFVFGHVTGDTGVGNTATRIIVDASDTVQVRTNQSIFDNSAAIDNVYDLNRDGRVDATDTVMVRTNQDIFGSVAPISLPSSFSTLNSLAASEASGKTEDDKNASEAEKDSVFETTDDFLID